MKKQYLLTILITIVISIPSFSQTTALVWANNINNPSTSNYGLNYAEEVVVDNNGNYYVTGSFEQPLDMDPSTNTVMITPPNPGTNHMYIAKYNGNGSLIWVNTIGNSSRTEGLDLFLDSNNVLYVTGVAHDSVDFDPGPGVFKIGRPSLDYAFAAKYDTSGSFISAFYINGWTVGYGIAVDDLGYIYITGEFAATCDFDPSPSTYNIASAKNGVFWTWDIFYAKYTSTGNLVWAKSMGSNAGQTNTNGQKTEYGICIGVDNNTGNVAIGAQFGSPGKSLMLLVDSIGTTIRSLILSDESTATGVKFDSNSNLYFSGDYGWNSSTENFDWNGGTYNLTPNSTYGLGYVVKYNSAYNIQWAVKVPNVNQFNRNLEISLDNMNDILFVGSEASTVSSSHIIFGKLYASNGALAWRNNITGSGSGGNNGNNGNGIAYSPTDNNVIVVGTIGQNFSNPCTIDADPQASVYNLVTVAGMELFMGKYGTCAAAPAQPIVISGDTLICSGSMNTYSVTNDPSATSYTWTLPGGWTGTSTTNSINVIASSSGGTITVTANNSCGSSTIQTLNVTVKSLPNTSVSQAGNTLTAQNINSGVTYQWLDCNNNFSMISGATNQIYSAMANGSYAVQITENGCIDTSSCYTVIGTGIFEHDAANFTVYPNPARNIINVNLVNCNIDGEVILVSSSGKLVFSSTTKNNKLKVDVSDYAKGTYFIHVKTNQGLLSKSIIIE